MHKRVAILLLLGAVVAALGAGPVRLTARAEKPTGQPTAFFDEEADRLLKEQLTRDEYPGGEEPTGGIDATWLNNVIRDMGTVTMRDVSLGSKLRGATDDTVRVLTHQTAAPRNVLLFTDTGAVAFKWRADTIQAEPTSNSCYGNAIGDVDRDGQNELVWGGNSYNLRWAKWNGSSWTIQTITTAASAIYDIAIGDANNDGVADEVIYSTGTNVYRAVFVSAPNTWAVTQILVGTYGTCYGVAIGNWDPTKAGNEVAAVTYGQTVARIWWNSGTSSWEVVVGTFGVDLDFYDVACGNFDPNNPGDELAVNNGYLYNPTYGAIGEVTFDGTTFNWYALYIPAAGAWSSYGEIAVGNYIDATVGIAAVCGGTTQPVRGVYWSSGAGAWVNEALYTTSGTSYGIAIGDVNRRRSYNKEIAVSTYGKTWEIEQDPPVLNNVGATAAWFEAPYTAVQGESRQVTMTITNFGLATETSIPVWYNVGAGNVTETWTGSLAPAATVNYTFTTPWVAGGPGSQPITVSTALPGDGNPANDAFASFFDVFITGTRTGQLFNVSTFPPRGWTNQALVGTYLWEYFTVGSSPVCAPYEGVGMAGYRSFSSSNGNEALMVSHGFDVGASPQKIRLRFFMYGDPAYTGNPDSVKILVSQDSVNWAWKAAFHRYNPIAAWYQRDIDLGDYAAGTRLWIGFLAHSGYGNNMYIDSARAWIDTPTSPVNDLGVAAILSPTMGVTLSGRPPLPSFTPTCRVQNYGLAAQSNFAVRCTVYGAGGVVRSAQQVTVAGPLALGQTADVPFANWTATEPELLTFAFRTVLGGDQNAANDQQQGTVDILVPHYTGYDPVTGATWIDSDTTGGPAYGWIDISATGTDVPLASFDDSYAEIPIGFDFNFLGNVYSAVNVATNGYLQFGTGSSSLSNTGIPNSGAPNDIIAMMWDDLHCLELGRVKYELLGSEPNRSLVVSYNNIRYYGSGDSTLTFQVILNEGTNAVVVQYADVATGHATRDYGISATLGIENSDGTGGLQYCLDGAPVTERPQPGRAIRYLVPVHDVGAIAISVPANGATYPVGTQLAPEATVQNFGNVTEDIPVMFTDLAMGWFDIKTAAGVAPGATASVTFAQTPSLVAGYHSMVVATTLSGDPNPANDVLLGGFLVMNAPALESPVGVTVDVLRPLFQWADLDGTSDYSIDVDNDADFSSPAFAATGLLVSEATPDVDLAEGHWYWRVRGQNGGLFGPWQAAEFDIVLGPPPTGGWTYVGPAMGPTLFKYGAWLANDGEKTYVAKGNKSLEAYSFDGTEYTPIAPLPTGTRLPKKGAKGVAAGVSRLYHVRGSNTQDFYMFDGNAWVAETPVPLGPTNKKVKGGDDMVYVDMVDSGFVYLLKGYKNEFWKYNTLQKTWTQLPNAPADKWSEGSWLAYNDGIIYAHQAKVHGFYAFDVATDLWSPTPLTGMPIPSGLTGKSKKSKDGGSAAVLDGVIYAFKGGNTQEFWGFDIAAGTWAERETIPAVAPGTTKKKRVKVGGDIAAAGDVLYAIKANKTSDLWMYGFGGAPAYIPRSNRDGVMAGATPVGTGFAISPNPVASGWATLRYSLPKAGAASLCVFDVTGRTVVTRTLAASRTGAVALDLRSLPAGVYLAKLSGEGFSTSQKLVVEK